MITKFRDPAEEFAAENVGRSFRRRSGKQTYKVLGAAYNPYIYSRSKAVVVQPAGYGASKQYIPVGVMLKKFVEVKPPTPKESGAVTLECEALEYLLEGKDELRRAFVKVQEDPALNRGIRAMFDRTDYFEDLTPTLSGIAAHPPAREFIDRELSKYFERCGRDFIGGDYEGYEVVVGGGLHAAIYSATRQGTIVFERGRVGGVFARPGGHAFKLNSRNRPGGGGFPGSNAALNYIPGGLIQPSDISAEEYQTNDDFAFCIRLNLALTASAVVQGVRVESVAPNGVYTDRERFFSADRIILATGIGTPKGNFEQFLTRTRCDFPLEGLRKVAVVGAGDSSKVAIEFLLGMVPQMGGFSTAELDYVERIDWIGQSCMTKEQFERNERSRYAGIGRHMPREADPNYYSRVFPVPGRANFIGIDSVGYEDQYGDRYTKTYDLVIDCTGYQPNPARLVFDAPLTPVYDENGRCVAKRYGTSDVFQVGPMMNLDPTSDEKQIPALRKIKENSAAAFRYADRTAKFAEVVNGI